MRFQREILTPELVAEIAPLLTKHYREIAHYQDIPLDPAFDQYLAMENAGFLRVFTCRALIYGHEKLVGYSIFFVRHNMHYRGSLQAVQDILFLHPDFRDVGFGSKLIEFCDSELKKESVQAVYHHVKQAHNFGPLLEKQGYQLIDLIYARRLD